MRRERDVPKVGVDEVHPRVCDLYDDVRRPRFGYGQVRREVDDLDAAVLRRRDRSHRGGREGRPRKGRYERGLTLTVGVMSESRTRLGRHRYMVI
jgi:hypothetical protein